jgi:hypothetical protein
MNKNARDLRIYRTVTYSLLILDIGLIVWIAQTGFIPRWWANMAVRPVVTLPTPIIDPKPFEFCALSKTADPWTAARAGTRVPMVPVVLGVTPTVEPTITVGPGTSHQNSPIGPTPTFESTATQPVYDELGSWQVEAVDMGNFKVTNFHIVVVGVGYTDTENEPYLKSLVSQIEVNFTKVHVDFAYVKSPLMMNLKHVATAVEFSNNADLSTLMNKIRKVHPIDSIVIAVKTALDLGNSDLQYYAIATGNGPDTAIWTSHEIAHLLGLGDGYKAYYSPKALPGTELFYIDEMPRLLSDALTKLGKAPPMYEVGDCNGRKVYQFYEYENNLMAGNTPVKANSWGDTLFTPLQIIEMNDYIAALK